MSLETRAEEIADEFAFLDDWEDRYAHLIDLGKANPPLAAHERSEDTRVRGCASQVWMVFDDAPDGQLRLRAESDAMIVSGLITILVRLFSGSDSAAVRSFDTEGFLDKIGVSGALTAQRSNGLASMVARIRREASAPNQMV